VPSSACLSSLRSLYIARAHHREAGSRHCCRAVQRLRQIVGR